MSFRVGIDVGGTFTDLIFVHDETGDVRVAKEPTTPAEMESGVVLSLDAGVPADAVGDVDYLMHGTTVGLNALLERRGAVVGLLATEGLRDVIEIGRGDKTETYNLFWRQPEPLVPRRRRLGVRGRILADGSVQTPLNRDDVAAALETFQAQGVEAIAVAFMNAYANGDHERAAEVMLRELGFEGDISVSHRISREYREYPRTCTTVIDAYVRPRITRYLHRLEDELRARGVRGGLFCARSGGGAMSFAEARARPFETTLSGPVGGAEGAGEVARQLGLRSIIAADVGGTSFDACLITDGRPRLMYEGTILELPLQAPWVDVRTIGAGGGSVAYIDVGDRLRVGPRSAGAAPGPAAYGRGGTEATVTDAACVLGMLGSVDLAGGVRLDAQAARAALNELGSRLSMDLDEIARGVVQIASASMAEAIREITIERGQDPRESALLAFGGAGPMFGGLLAAELDIPEVIIPPHAGIFSAWGLLGAEPTQAAVQTRIVRLEHEEAVVGADALAHDLFAELATRAEGGLDGAVREVALDMRYAGQDHTLTVEMPGHTGRIETDVRGLRRRFAELYANTFDHTMDSAVEIVSVRALMRRPLAARRLAAGGGVSGRGGEVEAYSFAQGRRRPFTVVDRASLSPTERLAGPAIITEPTSTTYLDAGQRLRLDESGCLRIRRADAT